MIPVNLCGMRLNAPENWVFMPNGNSIFGRTETQVGVLRISSINLESPEPLTVEQLENMSRAFVSNETALKPFDLKKPVSKNPLFSGASYRLKKDKRDFFTRVWYLYRDKKLALAAYGCPWRQRAEEDTLQELHQCERMVMTIRQG